MAKKSLQNRELKRQRLVKKHSERRRELKSRVRDPRSSVEEKLEAVADLQRLPRNSSPVRLRNRCGVTGRPKGFYRKFGLSRNKLREATMRGDVPGLHKASW